MADSNADTIRSLEREREGWAKAGGHDETVKAIDHLLSLLRKTKPKK